MTYIKLTKQATRLVEMLMRNYYDDQNVPIFVGEELGLTYGSI